MLRTASEQTSHNTGIYNVPARPAFDSSYKAKQFLLCPVERCGFHRALVI
jgi:hypothetical protein